MPQLLLALEVPHAGENVIHVRKKLIQPGDLTDAEWRCTLAKDASGRKILMRHRQFPTRAVVAIAGTSLLATLTAPTAHADDPLAPIKSTISRDRENACHDTGGYDSFQYEKSLEAVAQVFARSEKKPEQQAGYQRTTAFLGAGDPQAQAINRAYEHGARQVISDCAYKRYGVGFVRHEDRSVDVVTMIFGVLIPVPLSNSHETPVPPK